MPYQNKVNAINIFVLPVLTFFMPVLYFSHNDLSEIDLKIKRLLTERVALVSGLPKGLG